jgi:phage terminase large subunit
VASGSVSRDVSVKVVTLPFTPRPWQVPLLDCASRSIVAVVHRRAGKSTAFVWRGLRQALTEERRHIPAARRNLKSDPPRVVHVLPAQVMWKRTGLWDKVTRAAETIPGAVVFKSEMRVVLPNGGIYQAGGMDKPDSWRGGYADSVIEDEADDVIATGLDMVVEPMLADYGGSRVKIGTPKGNGRLKKAYEDASPDSRFLLPYQKTNAIPADEVEELRRKLDPEEFAQELECSFTAPNSGSYFGKWLDEALADERICRVLYDPALPVHTCWDLGIDDSTAIWWFQRSAGGEWRWLEYYEDAGPGLDEYARIVLSKPYIYGKHYLPHDVENRELTYQGKSRRHFLNAHGIKPVVVVPAANPADRIHAARTIMPRSWFDAEGCQKGLELLRLYRRQWNETMGVWRAEPLHDGASHCADAFGTGVQGSRSPENDTGPKLPALLPPLRHTTRPGGAWLGR